MNKMPVKKLNKIQKWYLKYTNREMYKDYKKMLRSFDFLKNTESLVHPPMNHAYKETTTFMHSGNSGDIIYSLPTILELSKNGKAEILLQADQKGVYDEFHPLGAVMLNDKVIDMLIPLLEYQPQISVCKKFEGEAIDYNLDVFRSYSFLLDKGSITRWYFHVFGVFHNTSKPWLIAPKDEKYKNSLVIARSHRYRSPVVDYAFLSKYSDVYFIGIAEEFDDMKKSIAHIKHIPVNNFLEMATVINSCKLFIGNQSFPYSIAEGLKANRLLEVCYKCPNVIVEGEGGHDFIYQPQFEYIVNQLLN
jgi:hypothetical protein